MFLFHWLENAVSWVLVQFHQVFGAVLGDDSGVAWVLSIVGLVVVIRALLIPLFVKQIRAQRNLQLIQPQLKEIQTKYAGDRDRQSQEMMALYKETGTNPFASCLPIVAQAPIFYALFQVLRGAALGRPVGVFGWERYAHLLKSAQSAEIVGVPIYGTFARALETPNPGNTKILAVILIVLMSLTSFITQRQLMMKNTAADNPVAQQMKIMMYIFPFMFAIGGLNFPIGVLIYWLTTNLWTMGQQFYVIRNNPQPGTPAAAALAERRAAAAAKKGQIIQVDPHTGGIVAPSATSGSAVALGVDDVASPEPTRNQPKRKPKSKRKQNPGGAS
ncbi:MAG: membrane protein insertase YidC [Candidatus Nanopelagicales bacterium]